MAHIIRECPCGSIRGNLLEGDIESYLGIRYATAERWQYPTEVTSWIGEYPATAFGDACVQRRTYEPETEDSFYYREFRRNDHYTYSEGCQYLNLWIPKDAENAPVLLYIHGGAFQTGCGSESTFDGEGYARRGILFATCNYRLGPMGFCSHPDLAKRDGHTGNYGLFDQLTAITWLYHNIRSFGGNPENITVMGQSAGAMSIQQLCSTGLLEGKIAKAIMTSGGGLGREFAGFLNCSDTYEFWEQVFQELGGSLEAVLKQDPGQIIETTYRLIGNDLKLMDCVMPVLDHRIIRYRGDEVLSHNEYLKIPYLLGTTKDDMLPEILRKMAEEWTTLQAKESAAPAYDFYFARNLPGDDQGAWHSSELWYTIGNLKKSWRPFGEYDELLSQHMMAYITNFAASGNPNGDGLRQWDAVTDTVHSLMIFDDDSEK